MSKQFYFKQFSLAYVHSLNEVRSLNVKIVLFQVIQFSISTLFDPYIGPYQVPPLRARVDLE